MLPSRCSEQWFEICLSFVYNRKRGHLSAAPLAKIKCVCMKVIFMTAKKLAAHFNTTLLEAALE